MDLLTVQEAAKELRVSPITVRRYIKAGRLRCVRLGRLVRVHREELDRIAALGGPSTTPENPGKFERDRRMFELIQQGMSPEEAGWEPVGDSLKGIIGMAASEPGAPTDVSANKYKYLAQDYRDKIERDRRARTARRRR